MISCLTEYTMDMMRDYIKNNNTNFLAFVKSIDHKYNLILDTTTKSILGIIKEEDLIAHDDELIFWIDDVLKRGKYRKWVSFASAYRNFLQKYVYTYTHNCVFSSIFKDMFIYDAKIEPAITAIYRGDESVIDIERIHDNYVSGIFINIKDLSINKCNAKLILTQQTLLEAIAELMADYCYSRPTKINIMKTPNLQNKIKNVANKCNYSKIINQFYKIEHELSDDCSVFAFSLTKNNSSITTYDILSNDLINLADHVRNSNSSDSDYFKILEKVTYNINNTSYIKFYSTYYFPDTLIGKNVKITLKESKYWNQVTISIGKRSHSIRICDEDDLNIILDAFKNIISEEDANMMRCEYLLKNK